MLQRFGNGEYKRYQERGLSPEQTALELQGQFLDYEQDWWRRHFQIQFNTIQALSSMPYEGAKLNTSLALTLPNLETDISSLNSTIVHLTPREDNHYTLLAKNAKTLRKIAEGAKDCAVAFCYKTVPQQEQQILHFDEKCAYCFCGYVDLDQCKSLDIFPVKIEISGPQRWSLSYFGKKQFEVENNSIQFTKESSLVDEVLSTIQKEIPNVQETDDLRAIIEAINNQRHGTSVIFYSTNAEGNGLITERFKTLCKNLRGMECNEPWEKFVRRDGNGNGSYPGITNLAGIDGALVLDPVQQMVLYAMIIVDGVVRKSGDPSRGARHNSIKTFMDELADLKELPAEARAVAVVFSEDGGAISWSLSKLRSKKQ